MKKTINADLEHRRPAWFLIGLVVASAFFVVALELSFKDDGDYLDGDFLDEIAEDMELMPPLEDSFMEEPEIPVDGRAHQRSTNTALCHSIAHKCPSIHSMLSGIPG